MTISLNRYTQQKSELEQKLSSPDVAKNQKELARIGKEIQRIDTILDLQASVDALTKETKELQDVAQSDDKELSQLATQELEEKNILLEKQTQALTIALTPPEPSDSRDAIIEIRAGAGGDEAALFAAELYRAYTRFAEHKKWSCHSVSLNRTGIGGYKEVVFEIQGTNVYGEMKYESGVHRVQRVPETEKSGRVHTSTATVAVIPLVEEDDVDLKPDDLKIEITTSSGHGGQSVNTTYSAVRMTHLPTGITVQCQDERSQKQNKEKAMEVMRARVYAFEEEKRMKKESALRRGQIGTGDRSEKIRTYNFPQDRVTDHRIKQNFHNLPAIMDGAFHEIIDTIKLEETKQRSQYDAQKEKNNN